MSDRDLVRRHVSKLVREARDQHIPPDVVGRLLVLEAIELWKQERTLADVSQELEFIAGHLDPDTDFEFMRP
jgi:hypothetical protein